MAASIALLCVVNVGGAGELSMKDLAAKDLAAIFADAGCRDVETYIQTKRLMIIRMIVDESAHICQYIRQYS
jgi:uncharacterized protein (DUF1697 family)